MTEIQFVKKHYWMDPQTEDLIIGDELAEGMVVLLEDNNWRTTAELRNNNEFEFDRAMQYNRWTTVESLYRSGDNLVFIGRYDDGTKRTFITQETSGWFVKRDSCPNSDVPKITPEQLPQIIEELNSPERAMRMAAVQEGIKNRVQYAMVKQDSATYAGESSSPELDGITDQVVADIFKIAEEGLLHGKVPSTDPVPTQTDIPVYSPEPSPSTGITLDELDRRTQELM